MSRQYLVIFGPPCSGKTLNAEAIKKALGYDHAFDVGFDTVQIQAASGRIILFSQNEQVRHPDHLVRPYQYVMRRKPIEAVKRLLGSKWVEPNVMSLP